MAVTRKLFILLVGHMMHIFSWTVLYKILLHLMVQQCISMSFRATGGMMVVITSPVLWRREPNLCCSLH